MKIYAWMAALFYWYKQIHIYTHTLQTYNILNVMNTLVVCQLYHITVFSVLLYYCAYVCTHVHGNTVVNVLNQNATSVKVNVNTGHTN